MRKISGGYKMNDLTAIVLTLNEELNIKDCINSIKKVTDKIIIIDSGSTDQTLEIAKSMGARVFYNKFITHAIQFNWALDNVEIETNWIIRIDADERVTDSLSIEIRNLMSSQIPEVVSGYVIKFKTVFLGKHLRWGGVYPFKKLVVFRKGIGRYEEKQMDEHILLSKGKSKEFKNDALHYDFKDIDSLVRKHSWYATKEMLRKIKYNLESSKI